MLLLLLVLVLAALPLAAPAWPAAAEPDPGAESDLVAAANRERAARGAPPVTVAGDLQALARRHAHRMAERGEIHHNPALRAEAGDDWEELGENVGRGGDAAAVHAAFMDSPAHAAVILRPSYEEVGVGVVRTGDTIWVVEVFRRRAGAPAQGAVAHDPSPAAQPSSAPGGDGAPPAAAAPVPIADGGPGPVAAGGPAASAGGPAPHRHADPDQGGSGSGRGPRLVALGGLDLPAQPVRLTADAIAHGEPVAAVPGVAVLAAALLPLVTATQGALVRRLGLA